LFQNQPQHGRKGKKWPFLKIKNQKVLEIWVL
jgi:hypothetical protein